MAGAGGPPGRLSVPAGRPVNLPGRLRPPGLQDVFVSGPGVVAVALPLDDLEGAGRANIQTGAQAVAEDLADENGLVLGIEGQGPFGASGGAEAAAVALVAIDLDDLSLNFCSPRA